MPAKAHLHMEWMELEAQKWPWGNRLAAAGPRVAWGGVRPPCLNRIIPYCFHSRFPVSWSTTCLCQTQACPEDCLSTWREK